jgi:hypothetical protein
VSTVFHETSAEPRTEAVPLSHISLELGHLYLEDFLAGPDRLRQLFSDLRPWAETARTVLSQRLARTKKTMRQRPRISTCFLIDDYFSRFSSPSELVPMLLAEADGQGLTIDYLARESGCASTGGIDIAASLVRRLVEMPPPGTDGSRPLAKEAGWLSNGERTPATAAREAMSGLTGWTPPAQIGARRHSIFVDVQLWDEAEGHRTWSCPMLAAVWQLVRLGLLRHQGEPVLRPVHWTGDLPAEWDSLPPLLQLNPSAHPFAAYETVSLISSRFLTIETAVGVILEQLDLEPTVLRQVLKRADDEGLHIHKDIAQRLSYCFLDS